VPAGSGWAPGTAIGAGVGALAGGHAGAVLAGALIGGAVGHAATTPPQVYVAPVAYPPPGYVYGADFMAPLWGR